MRSNDSYQKWTVVRPYFRMAVQLLTVILMIVGVTDTAQSSGGFMAANALLFFTVQSNITIALICFVFFVIELVALIRKKELEIPQWLYAVKFVFTVAITLTFLVYWCMLMPGMVAQGMAKYLGSASNLCCHTFVPIFAMVDWFIFDGKYRNKKYSFLLGTIMPLYYLVFAMICSTQNVNFGGGAKVPYFFLDYFTLGWFKIGKGGLGVFWWIWVVVAIVIGLSLLLMFGKNAVYKKLIVKEMNLPVDEVVTESVAEKNENEED